MQYTLGAVDPGFATTDNLDTVRKLNIELDGLYKAALDSNLSAIERNRLDRLIAETEAQVTALLNNQGQAYTPGGYKTDSGTSPASGQVVVNEGALVLGNAMEDRKVKPLPFIIGALAVGTAALFTFKG